MPGQRRLLQQQQEQQQEHPQGLRPLLERLLQLAVLVMMLSPTVPVQRKAQQQLLLGIKQPAEAVAAVAAVQAALEAA